MHMKLGDLQVMGRPCGTGHQGGREAHGSTRAQPLGGGLRQITLSLWEHIQNGVGIALKSF